METTSDVDALAILLATRDQVVGQVLAMDEDPSDGSGGPIAMELLGAVLRVPEPLLQAPSSCFFLMRYGIA